MARKQLSGGARITKRGQRAILLQPTFEQWDVLKAAAVSELRSLSNYVLVVALEEACKLLGDDHPLWRAMVDENCRRNPALAAIRDAGEREGVDRDS